MAQDDSAHHAQLLAIAEAGAREVGVIAPELKSKWEARAEQVRSGVITDADMQRWLTYHADYWQPKEREYADYVRRLAATYSPAIDI